MNALRPLWTVAFLAVAGWLALSCAGEPGGSDDDVAQQAADSAAIAAAGGSAAPADKREGEVVGQVVDVSCYLAQGLQGDAHRQCAEICANDLGIPLNILDDDGTMWRLVDDDMPGHDQNPTVVQFAEQRVRATGTLVEKGGNHALIVKSVTLLEGTPNAAALENSSNPELGRSFNVKTGGEAQNPCAGRASPANPCAGKANPCAGKANPCGGV